MDIRRNKTVLLVSSFFILKNVQGLKNKALIFYHMLKELLSLILDIKFAKEELKIITDEISFIFKTFNCELAPYIEIYLCNFYEADQAFCAQHGDVVVDVGANI